MKTKTIDFPVSPRWFDAVWANGTELLESDQILVGIHELVDFKSVVNDIDHNPHTVFMLLTEDFDLLCKRIHDNTNWFKPLPDGGIPPNVWIGASVQTQKQADSMMRRLVKLKARKRFVYLKPLHHQSIDLKAGLVAGRCSNCGSKTRYGRINRPTECPFKSLCAGSTIDPQIHWVVSADKHKSTQLMGLCHKLGVAYWDGATEERSQLCE